MPKEIYTFQINIYDAIREVIEEQKAELAELADELKWLEFLYFCHNGKFPTE